MIEQKNCGDPKCTACNPTPKHWESVFNQLPKHLELSVPLSTECWGWLTVRGRMDRDALDHLIKTLETLRETYLASDARAEACLRAAMREDTL